MKWSWKVGRIAGIDTYIHATFWLLIGWIALEHWLQGRSPLAVVSGVLFILALFGCVLLHELGHALTARRYGIRTRDITLLPIGGIARLERMPDVPIQELWVALAGPAVNLVIAAAIFVWLNFTAALEPWTGMTLVHGSFLARMMTTNVFLALFNLLPAFPMDGGRVLRAALATRLDYLRATQLAATIGQGMALVMGFGGLWLQNPYLVFIALFVWIGAAQESSMTQMRYALGGIPVGRAMITDYRSLAPADPLSRAVELIVSGLQQDFPVVDAGRVVGVLTRADLLVALAQQGQGATVEAVMQREFVQVAPTEMLETALARLQQCRCHTLPVVAGEQLVGLLTQENLGEFLMIQSALAQRRTRRTS
ncbi:MAG TPA: site-2 protease family protein [Candidatus Polarisedimenticolaceae bacterium]|nr:site-2 protease family protein [Candidatus Polarisedimenticolaceae bacterium]